MLLRIYFSATILLPSTAPKRGPPLLSQKQNTRRFASHHLQTPGHFIGGKERSNSGKPKIPRVICCNSSGLAETFSRTYRLCPLPQGSLMVFGFGPERSSQINFPALVITLLVGPKCRVAVTAKKRKRGLLTDRLQGRRLSTNT